MSENQGYWDLSLERFCLDFLGEEEARSKGKTTTPPPPYLEICLGGLQNNLGVIFLQVFPNIEKCD